MVGQYSFHGALEQWGDHGSIKVNIAVAKLSMKICDNKFPDVAIGNE